MESITIFAETYPVSEAEPLQLQHTDVTSHEIIIQ